MSETSDSTDDDPSTQFIDHFEPVLCETDDDRELLARVAERVADVERVDGDVHVHVDSDYGRETILCGPPFEGAVSPNVPDSFATLAGHHDGIEWEWAGGGVIGFPGLLEGGDLAAFSWDPVYLDHADNEAYGEALAAAGLDFDDVREAFAVGQNWIVFDPLSENERGEPRLAFVSHGMCELEEIRGIEEFGAGQVLLRLMAYAFLDADVLDPLYA